MENFLLWFSIALVICVFRFVRSRLAIHGLYLLILTVFDLWLLTFTYLFFTDVYLRPLSAGAKLILGLVRTLVSGTILFLYGELAVRLSGRRPTSLQRLLLFIAPGIYFAVVLGSLRSISFPLAGIVTVLYYAYLAALGVYANLTRKRRRGPLPENLQVFLGLSIVAFAVMILSGLPYFFGYAGALANVLPRAALCLSWGVAGTLCVAEKTVETHLYNIYRKCGCRNRVELLNSLRRYQSPD